MENEETKVDKELKSAFNDGFLIGLHKSDLANMLQKNYSKDAKEDPKNSDMLFEGMDEGIKTKERNLRIEQNLDSISEIRKSSKRNQDLSRDI
ncbi:MAG TPA: hypothetical protein DIW47_12140 [Bacteroidetes bacterium]|nr:hypothetical protein [Bacteroidota bacterium]